MFTRLDRFSILQAIFLLLVSSFGAFAQKQPIGFMGSFPYTTTTVLPPTTPTTLSALQVVGDATAALTTAIAHTTPTATQLCALFPGMQISSIMSWDWFIRNTAAGASTLTITAGSGVTGVGTLTIAQNNVKHFKWSLRGCGGTPAARLISLGTSVF